MAYLNRAEKSYGKVDRTSDKVEDALRRSPLQTALHGCTELGVGYARRA